MSEKKRIEELKKELKEATKEWREMTTDELNSKIGREVRDRKMDITIALKALLRRNP